MHSLAFTSADIARVRLAAGPELVSETLFSLKALRGNRDGAQLGAWRRRVRAGLGPWSRSLAAIAPQAAPCLDLAPLIGDDLDADDLLTRSKADVRFELEWFTRWTGRLPDPLRGLDDDLAVRRRVLDSLRAYRDLAVRPHWGAVEAVVGASRAARARDLADGGVDRLLSGLHPAVRWTGAALEIECDQQLETTLDGRGLDIVPSYFLRKPAIMFHGDRVALTYPAAFGGLPSAGAELEKLLGRTRAAILAAIADGIASPAALARSVGTSTAAVSQHTGVLRAAGLITTDRRKGSAAHALTPAAAVLLARA